MTHVLVTSISKKIPMVEAVKNACKKIGPSVKLFGADVDPDCLGKYFVDSFWQMPPLSTLYAADIIHYCRHNTITAIIPSRDGELLFFATIKEELEKNGIAVMVSDVNSVTLCLDKLLFSEALFSQKLPAIPTALSVEKLSSPTFVVKERFGAGSQGILVNVGKKEAIAHSKKLEHPIFQPFVAGREYSVDVFSDKHGAVKGVVARTRDRVIHGESQMTTTVSHKALEALAKKVVQKLGLIGHCVLQVLEDAMGNLHIIEANCRFGGASTLSVALGLDSFYWFLLEANKEDLKNYQFVKPRGERRLIRYPKDMVIEVE
jgi:carbamoyl-phosphate synthase large subunit